MHDYVKSVYSCRYTNAITAERTLKLIEWYKIELHPLVVLVHLWDVLPSSEPYMKHVVSVSSHNRIIFQT